MAKWPTYAASPDGREEYRMMDLDELERLAKAAKAVRVLAFMLMFGMYAVADLPFKSWRNITLIILVSLLATCCEEIGRRKAPHGE